MEGVEFGGINVREEWEITVGGYCRFRPEKEDIQKDRSRYGFSLGTIFDFQPDLLFPGRPNQHNCPALFDMQSPGKLLQLGSFLIR